MLGAVCTPADEDGDNRADSCATELSDDGLVIDGNSFFGAEVDCYCAAEDCFYDYNSDSIIDCYTPEGTDCVKAIDSENRYASCATNAMYASGLALGENGEFAEHVFTDADGQISSPLDEHDNDSDGFVECVEYDRTNWILSGGSINITGGSDCDDFDGFVYPEAEEYCDGQYNDCESLTYDPELAPADEIDDDGDGFVECLPTAGVPWGTADVPFKFMDAAGCVCDADCSDPSAVCVDEDGLSCAPDTATCVQTGGYEDCDDVDAFVYPTATEYCDGQYNDCDDPEYDALGAPDNEADLDGDGYVECDADGSVWSSDPAPLGYSDCFDDEGAIMPDVEETCDGQFNNCNHPQLSAFEGVVSDCFCPSEDCTIDEDGNGFLIVEILLERSVHRSMRMKTTRLTLVLQLQFRQRSTEAFLAVWKLDCYCPSLDCSLDVLGNGEIDCLTPREWCALRLTMVQELLLGAPPSLVLSLSRISSCLRTEVALNAPLNELDNDGDGYVECEYLEELWEGSLSVVGGSDCDDLDLSVYPAAEGSCDGQYNDCENDYTDDSAPDDERDDDGDGWIECIRDSDEIWNAFDGSEEPNRFAFGSEIPAPQQEPVSVRRAAAQWAVWIQMETPVFRVSVSP